MDGPTADDKGTRSNSSFLFQKAATRAANRTRQTDPMVKRAVMAASERVEERRAGSVQRSAKVYQGAEHLPRPSAQNRKGFQRFSFHFADAYFSTASAAARRCSSAVQSPAWEDQSV